MRVCYDIVCCLVRHITRGHIRNIQHARPNRQLASHNTHSHTQGSLSSTHNTINTGNTQHTRTHNIHTSTAPHTPSTPHTHAHRRSMFFVIEHSGEDEYCLPVTVFEGSEVTRLQMASKFWEVSVSKSDVRVRFGKVCSVFVCRTSK